MQPPWLVLGFDDIILSICTTRQTMRTMMFAVSITPPPHTHTLSYVPPTPPTRDQSLQIPGHAHRPRRLQRRNGGGKFCAHVLHIRIVRRHQHLLFRVPHRPRHGVQLHHERGRHGLGPRSARDLDVQPPIQVAVARDGGAAGRKKGSAWERGKDIMVSKVSVFLSAHKTRPRSKNKKDRRRTRRTTLLV